MSFNDSAITLPNDVKPRVVLGLRRVGARLLDEIIVGIFSVTAAGIVWATAFGLGLSAGTHAVNQGTIAGFAQAGVAALWIWFFTIAGSIAAGIVARFGYYRWAARRPGDAAGLTVGHGALDLRVVRRDGVPMRGRSFVWRDLMLAILLVPCEIFGAFVASLTGSGDLGLLTLIVAASALVLRPALGALPHDRMADTRLIDTAAAPSRAGEVAPAFIKPTARPLG